MQKEIKNLDALVGQNEFIKGAKIKEIGNLKLKVDDIEEKKFGHTLSMAKNVALSCEYFKSNECKELMKKVNCAMTQDEFALNVFGFKKSWFQDLKKVGNFEPSVIEAYKLQTKESLSIANLLKFAKNEGKVTEGEGEGEGEAEVKKESFSVKFAKGKLTIKGADSLDKASYTLLIEELKRLQESAKA